MPPAVVRMYGRQAAGDPAMAVLGGRAGDGPRLLNGGWRRSGERGVVVPESAHYDRAAQRGGGGSRLARPESPAGQRTVAVPALALKLVGGGVGRFLCAQVKQTPTVL
jgi:hypothetical protein